MNLLTHLRDRHPDLYAEASPKVAKKSATAASSANENRQPTLLQSIKQSAKYGAHSSGNICVEIFVCVWYKRAIRENLQQNWLYCRADCIADHHRARLTPENVDKLVFLASNMQ